MQKSKIILIFTFIFLPLFIGASFLIFNVPTNAQTATKSATPSSTVSVDDKVSELKERIATQVARLNIIKKRGITGTISDSSNHQIILEDQKGSKRFIDVDELTKFTDLEGNQIGISDLVKGKQISVIGLYNTESRRLLARFILKVESFPQRLKGEVQDLDKKNFTIEMFDSQLKDTRIVNVETTTKTNEWTKDGGIVKSGFSKIQVGEKILVFGFPKTPASTPSASPRLTATRILVLPELTPNIKLPSLPPTSPTATPTAKPSPKKVQPTITQ